MGEVNYCGISGGKDSAATALWLIHESGLDPASIRFAFCNTHNEHQFTYDYIEMLSVRFVAWGYPPISWLEPERGFMELAKWKHRFPSRKARFCTQFLKVIPTRLDIEKIQHAGSDVILFSGVRRAESPDREKLEAQSFDDGFGCMVNRPILTWTTDQVFAYLEKFSIPRNPLYDYGARRVGCFPCINSAKQEIRAIAEHFPERIVQIRTQEEELGSTFFSRKTTPLRFRSKTVDTKKGPMQVPTIDDVVEWSKTHRGGRTKSLKLFEYEGMVCRSGVGMCE